MFILFMYQIRLVQRTILCYIFNNFICCLILFKIITIILSRHDTFISHSLHKIGILYYKVILGIYSLFCVYIITLLPTCFITLPYTALYI